MKALDTVSIAIEDSRATITLNRPEALNAFNATLRGELLSAVNAVNADDSIRVVIITGAGRGFCSGADLAERNPPEQTVEQRLNDQYKPILTGIAEAPKPWIAAVNGVAAGIGGALVMACDLVVMAETACFYQAFASVGLIPDGGTSWHLNRQLGPKKAFELLATGAKIDAQQSLQLGLVNRVAAAADVLTVAGELAAGLLDKAPLSLRYTKQALRETAEMSLGDAISHEARLQLLTNRSADHAEGKRAFLERRKPQWQGS